MILEPMSGVSPKAPELTRAQRTSNAGDSTVLTCEAQGNPPPKLMYGILMAN